MTKRRTFIVLTLLLAFTGGGIVQLSLSNSPVDALSNSGFNPELIITDDVFTDKNSMSASQIQSFLESKNSTCLKNFTTLSLVDSNKDGMGDEPYGKGKGEKVRASTLIYQASQIYGISPKVLLATLQKEQGLITRQDCPSWRYNTALGYGCPDSAPCDSSSYGFTRQIDYGTWHFKGFFHDTYPIPPTVPGKKTIAYNPDGRCGGKSITIANRATAALYSYTPYQPNSYTLSGGTNDSYPSCGAFGNLNFWRYFTQWFGSTWGSPFVAYNGTTYIDGANNSYYRVLNPETLKAYGYGTAFKSTRAVNSAYFNGKTNKGNLPLVARFEGDAIYAVANGGVSQFTSRSLYESTYGYTLGEEAQLSQSWLIRFKKISQMTSIIKLSDGSPVYYVTNGKKNHISSPTAYSTTGTPTYSSQPSVTLNSLFANSLLSGPPVLAANTVVKASGTNKIYFWNGSQLTAITGSAGLAIANKVVYTAPASQLLQLPQNSAVIEQYVKSNAEQYYLLHQSRKIPLTDTDLSKLSVNKSVVPVAPDQLLNLFSTTAYDSVSLLRFGSEDRVYRQVPSKELYRVVDRYDFDRFKLSFNNVVSLPEEVKQLINDRGYQFSQKRLVQVAGAPEVYVSDIGSKKLYHIPSRELAKQYGISLVNIASVPSLSSASSYTMSSLGRFVKDADGLIWLIDHKIRYQVPVTLLASFGYSGSSVFNILPASLLSPYPNRGQLTQYIRDYSSGAVYRIVDGKKRWFTSRQKLEQSTSWSNVRSVSPEYIKTIPSGPSI